MTYPNTNLAGARRRQRVGLRVVLAVALTLLAIGASCSTSGEAEEVAINPTSSSGLWFPEGTGPTHQVSETWKIDASCDEATLCGLAGDDDGLYAATTGPGQPQFEALDPDDGSTLWTADADPGTLLTITDGALYAFTLGIDQQRLVQMDRGSGKERWTAEVDPGTFLLPVLVEGSVLVGNPAASFDADPNTGRTTSYSSHDGTVQWTTTDWVVASCDDAVYLADDGQIVQIDRVSGVEQWRGGEPGAEEILRVACAPEGLALATADLDDRSNSALAVLNSADGDPRWTVPLDVGESGTVLETTDEVVVTGGRTEMRAFDLERGVQVWTNSDDLGEQTISAMVDGALLVAAAGFEVRLIDPSSGRQVGAVDLDDADEIALRGNLLIAVAGEEQRGIDITEPAEVWSLALGSDYWPALSGGRVYAVGADSITAYG